jgi:glycosyltransferase involved in cell wall biosynthesis
MKGKRIIMAVSNDLVADQRVHRSAETLTGEGADVLVVGRKLSHSQDVGKRMYRVKRMQLLFSKGPLFYACLNFRLFLFLLFHRADILVSNDLDTLLACFLVCRLRKLPLVYDSHEYFTEMPELIGRNLTRKIWRSIENRILPGLEYTLTVSESVARAYTERYGIKMEVVRNLPTSERKESRRPDQLVCGPRKVIIYQGSLNAGRGLESMIRAMKYLETFQLQIFGDGDIRENLKQLVVELDLGERIDFMGRLPFTELREYTRQASLGISLEEDLGLNYRYALPNKLFDYIHAGIPVLVSDLPEMRKVVEEYGIGQVLEDADPHKLAEQVHTMMNSDELRMEWKRNLSAAAGELCWEKEKDKLLEVYRRAISS